MHRRKPNRHQNEVKNTELTSTQSVSHAQRLRIQTALKREKNLISLKYAPVSIGLTLIVPSGMILLFMPGGLMNYAVRWMGKYWIDFYWYLNKENFETTDQLYLDTMKVYQEIKNEFLQAPVCKGIPDAQCISTLVKKMLDPKTYSKALEAHHIPKEMLPLDIESYFKSSRDYKNIHEKVSLLAKLMSRFVDNEAIIPYVDPNTHHLLPEFQNGKLSFLADFVTKMEPDFLNYKKSKRSFFMEAIKNKKLMEKVVGVPIMNLKLLTLGLTLAKYFVAIDPIVLRLHYSYVRNPLSIDPDKEDLTKIEAIELERTLAARIEELEPAANRNAWMARVTSLFLLPYAIFHLIMGDEELTLAFSTFCILVLVTAVHDWERYYANYQKKKHFAENYHNLEKNLKLIAGEDGFLFSCEGYQDSKQSLEYSHFTLHVKEHEELSAEIVSQVIKNELFYQGIEYFSKHNQISIYADNKLNESTAKRIHDRVSIALKRLLSLRELQWQINQLAKALQGDDAFVTVIATKDRNKFPIKLFILAIPEAYHAVIDLFLKKAFPELRVKGHLIYIEGFTKTNEKILAEACHEIERIKTENNKAKILPASHNRVGENKGHEIEVAELEQTQPASVKRHHLALTQTPSIAKSVKPQSIQWKSGSYDGKTDSNIIPYRPGMYLLCDKNLPKSFIDKMERGKAVGKHGPGIRLFDHVHRAQYPNHIIGDIKLTDERYGLLTYEHSKTGEMLLKVDQIGKKKHS